MYVIEILLPMYDNTGGRFPAAVFEQVRLDLTRRFGGVTALVRSPAVGLWRDQSGTIHHDDIAIFEVMVEAVDHRWWRAYREQLERHFRQEQIIVRAGLVERL